jgi:hypothetical protein
MGALRPILPHRGEAHPARLAQPDSSSREPQSSAIAGAREREPPQEQTSSPHRARILCTTELTRWPDRTDDRHRAGESQNRPAEPCLQHPPTGECWIGSLPHKGVVRPARPQAGARRTKQSLLTTNYALKSPSWRAGDQSDEGIVIVRGALYKTDFC